MPIKACTELASEVRRSVFWMKRDGRELIGGLDPERVRAQREMLADFQASIGANIERGMLSEVEARGLRRSMGSFLGRIARAEIGKAAIRYRLRAEHRGRDWGVGRVANRCLECQLDNVRLYLAKDGRAASRSARKLNSMLKENPAELALVQDHFRTVPRARREEQAKLFLSLFLKGTTTQLATELRDQVLHYREKHPEHFTDEDSPPCPDDFDWCLLDSLQRKIGALKKRIQT